MNKREVVRMSLEFKQPPYVPWSFSFTKEAIQKLMERYGAPQIGEVLQDHFMSLGNDMGYWDDIGNDCIQDVFGVVWDRSRDKDIGIVKGVVLPEPTLKNYLFPNPVDKRVFADCHATIRKCGDRFRVFSVGFSLYERAWTMRGMENLMMDFYENPQFVHDLLNTIADYNIAQIEEALNYDIDAVRFGDDWGQQHGLQMGLRIWRQFIYPVLKRMYGKVRELASL